VPLRSIAGWGNVFSADTRRPTKRAPPRCLSIGDGDHHSAVQQGQQTDSDGLRLACIDCARDGPGSLCEQARSYLQSRLKIGSKVNLLSQTVDRFWPHRGRRIGEVNLNFWRCGRTGWLCVSEVLEPLDEKAYLDDENQSQPAPLWGVEGCLAESPGPWDFRRSRRSSGSAADCQIRSGGRRYRCSEIGSYAWPELLRRGSQLSLYATANGEACETSAPLR